MTCNAPPRPPVPLPSSLEMRITIGVPAAITTWPSTTTSFQTWLSTGYPTRNLLAFDVMRSSSSPNTTVPRGRTSSAEKTSAGAASSRQPAWSAKRVFIVIPAVREARRILRHPGAPSRFEQRSCVWDWTKHAIAHSLPNAPTGSMRVARNAGAGDGQDRRHCEDCKHERESRRIERADAEQHCAEQLPDDERDHGSDQRSGHSADARRRVR